MKTSTLFWPARQRKQTVFATVLMTLALLLISLPLAVSLTAGTKDAAIAAPIPVQARSKSLQVKRDSESVRTRPTPPVRAKLDEVGASRGLLLTVRKGASRGSRGKALVIQRLPPAALVKAIDATAKSSHKPFTMEALPALPDDGSSEIATLYVQRLTLEAEKEGLMRHIQQKLDDSPRR